MSPRYKKILNDLLGNRLQSLLLIVAIMAGISGVGSVLGAYAILNREMSRNYLGTKPAHATIVMHKGVTSSDIAEVKRIPGVVDAEIRATSIARVKIGETWQRMLLIVVNDFADMRTGTFTHLSGARLPPEGSVLLERSVLEVMHTSVGSRIAVKMPEGALTELTVAGVVHDPGLAPARQEQTVYGYITPATYHLLGNGTMDQIRIITSFASDGEVAATAARAASVLANRGNAVHEIRIPPVNRHPHFTQMNAILTLLMVFAFLLLFLSAVLVSNAVSVLMVRQVREIGIMKTIGAGWRQIAAMYLLMIILIAATGTFASLPLGALAASAFADRIGDLLNFTIVDHSIPLWAIAVQLAAGVLIPLMVAGSSVVRGSRITIHKAITGNDIGRETLRRRSVGGGGTFARMMGSTATIAMRNLFRRKGRLALALTLLGAAGAMFISALNVAKAWDVNLDKVMAQRHYALEIQLSDFSEIDPLARTIGDMDGVSKVELWGAVPTSIAVPGNFDIAHTYPDMGHGSFTLMGVPEGMRAVDLPLLRGRWFTRDSSDEVVINHLVAAQAPHIKPGDSISLSVNGTPLTWRVAGIVEEDFSALKAYIPAGAFAELKGGADRKNVLRVLLDHGGQDFLAAKVREIEGILHDAGTPVVQVLPANVFRNAVAEHMGILVAVLLLAGALMGMVGMIGLMSTISMNVLERTRELGVMRAMGAAPRTIFRMLILEGMMVGASSVLIALLVSLPLSAKMGDLIGNMSFKMPLPLAVSYLAFGIWIVIILAGSIAATAYPALKAARMPVREALAYE